MITKTFAPEYGARIGKVRGSRKPVWTMIRQEFPKTGISPGRSGITRQ
jgi:hypothetical protein